MLGQPRWIAAPLTVSERRRPPSGHDLRRLAQAGLHCPERPEGLEPERPPNVVANDDASQFDVAARGWQIDAGVQWSLGRTERDLPWPRSVGIQLPQRAALLDLHRPSGVQPERLRGPLRPELDRSAERLRRQR